MAGIRSPSNRVAGRWVRAGRLRRAGHRRPDRGLQKGSRQRRESRGPCRGAATSRDTEDFLRDTGMLCGRHSACRRSSPERLLAAESQDRSTGREPFYLAGGSTERDPPEVRVALTVLPRLRHDTHIRKGRLPSLRVRLLRVVVGNRRQDDHVVALLPVDGCRHLPGRGQPA